MNATVARTITCKSCKFSTQRIGKLEDIHASLKRAGWTIKPTHCPTCNPGAK